MGRFIISGPSNSEYQFTLTADNGEVILTSERYASKAGALAGIASIRSNASRMERYDQKTASNGKYYFALKASNGEVIGVSEMYPSATARLNGIRAVMANALAASIEDQASSEQSLSSTPSELSIAQFVKEKRKQLNITQEDLANKAGVGLRFIRELEGGEKDTLRLDKVNQVLHLFGYTVGPVLLNRKG